MMPNGLDLLTVGVAILSYLIFLFTHGLLLRSSESFPASRAILFSLVLGLAINTLLLYLRLRDDFAFSQLFLIFFASTIIYILLIFHYLVWVFGMGEAAIRIRLLRELERTETKFATLAEIKKNYNAQKILNSRLERLMGAGHLTFDGKFYHLKSKILLIQIGVERFFKKLLGIPV